MEPIPSIDKAFSLIILEERQRALGLNFNPSMETTTLSVKTQNWSYEECYRLVEFPPSYKQRGRPTMANQVSTNQVASIEGDQYYPSKASSYSFPYNNNTNDSFPYNNNTNAFPFT